MLLNSVKTKAIGQKMSELQGQEYGWYLTRKLATSSFLELGKPSKVEQNSWLNAQVESGMVSHKCLEANLTNAKTTTNLNAGVCDYSRYFPL